MAAKGTVRSIVSGAMEKVRVGPRSKLPAFVAHGAPFRDDRPGQWAPGPLGLPPECPVQPLGFDGENHFFIDANGQLFATGDKAFGRERILKAFGRYTWYLYWAWPRWKPGAKGREPEVTGWKPEDAGEALSVAIAIKGPWRDFDKVRGLGAWTSPGGELILHRGEYLFYGGRLRHAGIELDGYFYPRRPALPPPAAEPTPAGDDVAERLFAFFATWNWKRPKVDPVLLLGWLGAAMLGGALKWRPSIFLTGDKGTGKSTLQEAMRELLGAGVISTPDTTAAGIYQRVRQDALPIAVDEIEAETDNRRAQAVIKLARAAASGGIMLRGGADSVGVEFQCRSAFLFSAIVPPAMSPQDLSRLGLLSLKTLDTAQPRPVLPEPGETAAKLLRRISDRWGSFGAIYEAYRDALRAGGHDARGQDTYGTFLACAHMLLGEEGLERLGYPYEDLSKWGELLDPVMLPEREFATATWRNCLGHLLSTQVATWRSGERTTVGQLLEDLAAKHDAPHAIGFDYAKRHLAQTGLGLIDANDGRNGKPAHGRLLAVPNSSPLVAMLFRGSVWGGEGSAGSWTTSLRDGPAGVILQDARINKIKLNGQSCRCTMIDLKAFDEYSED